MSKAQHHVALREKWTSRIQACQASPLTIAAFARDNKMSKVNLYYWSKRLGLPLKHKSPPEITFIELPLDDVRAALVKPDPISDDPISVPSAGRSLPTSVDLSPQQASADTCAAKPQTQQEDASIPMAPLMKETAYCVQMSTSHLNITLHLPWPQVITMIKTLA